MLPSNASVHRAAANDIDFRVDAARRSVCIALARLSWRVTNGVPFPLLEASPLYENEDLKEGSIQTVTPIEQVQDEGNCGEVTNRGEEACECAGKLTKNRRQPHSRHICEVTDRNLRACTKLCVMQEVLKYA